MSSPSSGPLGYVRSGAEPHRFSIIAGRPIRVGEYVRVRNGEGHILGLVERAPVHSHALGLASSYLNAAETSRSASENPRDKLYSAEVYSLGLLEELKQGRLMKPSLPPMPGEPVEEVAEDDLAQVFSPQGPQWVRVGALLRRRAVPVKVNVNAVASRHLAILAKTGSGKSNLLALLAKHISELGGTIIIFDYHGEYGELKVRAKHLVQPKLDPLRLSGDELADLLDIRPSASRQRDLVVRAQRSAGNQAQGYWERLEDFIKQDKMAKEETKEAVLRQLRQTLMRMERILKPGYGSTLEALRPDAVNIVDLSDLSEAQADLLIAWYLDDLLLDKKAKRSKFADVPVLCALEEAHTFLPGDRDTWTKPVAARVAREGRKFGLALILISQRPSKLDQDALSQMGSLAVMNLTQPRDQQYIIEATGELSEQMATYLPSLNPGEAILLGRWVTLPTLVMLDQAEEKLAGRDIDAVHEWGRRRRGKEVARESASEFLRE